MAAMRQTARIGVIGGTGQQGRGLALRLARAGAPVVIGSRSPDRARAAVLALRNQGGEIPLEAAENRAVIRSCEITFLTVPFESAAGTIERHKDMFRAGSLVIDVTVPVSFEGGRPRLLELAEGSATEHIRRRLAPKVRLAAALKTIPAHVLGAVDVPLDCDDFVCGDSQETRARAAEILRLIPGLRPIDAGPLEAARALERMTLLAIQINRRYKIHDARFRLVGL